MINYGKQDINKNDIQRVVDVLESDFLTQGPTVIDFEDTVAHKVGAKNAVAANSATSALHIACMSLGLVQGDILWTSPNSFVASSNCALYCGASIDFVDINPNTFNMCPDKLEEKLKDAKIQGKLPKILVPVHMCGQSCDMEKISYLSKEYGFNIIEDASHAIGGKYKNKYIGSCEFSDITIFSFHPVKIITTGEGGMALTNNDDIAHKMRLLRSHGITRDSNNFNNKNRDEEPWYYEQIDLGFNYRMSDIQAALGLSQIERLDEFVKKRNDIALFYNMAFKNSNIIEVPVIDDKCLSSFHLYIIKIKFSKEFTKVDLFNKMRKSGISLNCHYIPIHTQPYYRRLGFNAGDYPLAESCYENSVTIPLHPSLRQTDMDLVVKKFNEL